jgi:hypothetical protein
MKVLLKSRVSWTVMPYWLVPGLLHTKDERTKIVQNFGIYLPVGTVYMQEDLDLCCNLICDVSVISVAIKEENAS